MGVLRVLAVTMGRISTFRSYQIMLLFAAALAVVAFYYFGSEKQNFSSTTKRIKETQASHNSNRDDADLSTDIRSGSPESRTGAGDELEGKPSRVHALMMFTKVDKSLSLQQKFQVAMRSVAKHGRFLEDEVLVLHYVSDAGSRELGEKMLPELLLDATFRYETEGGILILWQKGHFNVLADMPSELKRIVQLDLDLKFRSNIRDLFQEFNQFPTEAVIGIAREMQPVYRHTFWQYRKENPKSRVGDPPPDGLPGFNSGVMLLNLDSMRRSTLYNQLLEPERVARLAEKYHFRGHLGDQDFFTMIGMEHRELFYPLSCGWNRQLCTWWREHGYGDVFQLYYRCDGPVHIYHGNCNTAIPDY
ncbi:xyloside xylosyltransferase 1-like [Sinocyclocheilus grahami]|uniref:xyloside xylosyltransferase 1-like n=1 Tax=Sinocyclocheilus grahami TaxID=75366 RepID=UPI0007AD1B94|nr:PREDICTED: xyloside xylosyltransferase 1-like [Sinocyclocheilus grahami]